jgi:hypothetical protein
MLRLVRTFIRVVVAFFPKGIPVSCFSAHFFLRIQSSESKERSPGSCDLCAVAAADKRYSDRLEATSPTAVAIDVTVL